MKSMLSDILSELGLPTHLPVLVEMLFVGLGQLHDEQQVMSVRDR